jgi:3-phosphoshikimate 1-carboxyvinyltransferase
MAHSLRTIELSIPSSKSLTHRALIMAACSTSACLIRNPLWGDDTRSTLGALQSWGVECQMQEDKDIRFLPGPFSEPTHVLDCGNSGTTLRLLIGQSARFRFETSFSGDASLSKRPNGQLLDLIEAQGAHLESNQGRLPIHVTGPFSGGAFTFPEMTSSQYASALLLSLPFLDTDSSLHLTKPVASRPYLNLTLDIARQFGMTLYEDETDDALSFRIPGGQSCSASSYDVEGDWSTAAFPLVAAAIQKQQVRLRCLRPNSRQGDKAVVNIMERFGARLHWEDNQLCFLPGDLQNPGHVDVSQTPDIFPALCVLATQVSGATRIDGAPHLRDKECDRIQAMHDGLTEIGIESESLPDGLIVHQGNLKGGQISSHADHRIHMAFALLNLITKEEIIISHPECVSVSYPSFHTHLKLFSNKDSSP